MAGMGCKFIVHSSMSFSITSFRFPIPQTKLPDSDFTEAPCPGNLRRHRFHPGSERTGCLIRLQKALVAGGLGRRTLINEAPLRQFYNAWFLLLRQTRCLGLDSSM